MYITTSRSPSSETVRLATLLSNVFPFSVFVRRGVKTFDKILADARRKGMSRVLFVAGESGKPGYLRAIAVSQYNWNDIGMYKIKKATVPKLDKAAMKAVRADFFKCDKASSELLGLEKNVSEMFSDTDMKITFKGTKGKKEKTLKIKTAEFEMSFGLEKVRGGD